MKSIGRVSLTMRLKKRKAEHRDDSPLRDSFPAASYSPVPPSGTVPSALRGLTAVFGMGTGVTPSLWRPESLPSGSTDGRNFRPTEYVGISSSINNGLAVFDANHGPATIAITIVA